MIAHDVSKAVVGPVAYLLPSSWEAPVLWVTVGILGSLVVVLMALVGWALVLRFLRHRKRRRQRRLEARWVPCLDAIVAGEVPDEALHKAVRPGEEETLLALLHRRAPDVSAQEVTMYRRLARPYLTYTYDATTPRAPEQRAYRVHRIGWLGEGEATSVLRWALTDPSTFVAMVAARALVRRKEASPESRAAEAELVVAALSRFKNWSRKSLAALLARMEGARHPLRQTFADADAALRVRLIAATALRELGDEAAAPIAMDLLQREDAPLELRATALRLLETVGRPAHAPFLRVLSYDANEVIRIRTLSALAHIGRPQDAQRFEEALNDPSQWVARQAAMGLVRLGRPEPLFTLIDTGHQRAALVRQVLMHSRIAA